MSVALAMLLSPRITMFESMSGILHVFLTLWVVREGPTTGALFRGLPILRRFLRGCCVGDGDGVGAGAGVGSGRVCSEDGGGDGDGSGCVGVASRRDGATSLRGEKRFAVVITGVMS
jgi:hypothetical protein